MLPSAETGRTRAPLPDPSGGSLRARLETSVALLAGAGTLGAGVAVTVLPEARGGGGPRLDAVWVAGALVLALASVAIAGAALPRRDRLLLLGVSPLTALLALVMPVLALLEPSVRDALVPAALQTAGGLALLVAAIRSVEAREDRLLAAPPGSARAKVTVLRGDDKTTKVTAGALQPGDRVLLAPGDPVPADGVIESGSGFADESALAGPSLPAAKQPGDTLLAGTTPAIPELVLRVVTPQAKSLVYERLALARGLSAELASARGADRALAFATIGLGVATGVLVLSTTPRAAIEVWLPGVASALLSACAAVGPLARGSARVRALARALAHGVVLSRAKDLLALGSIRRWQIDAALLAAPGEVELIATAAVPPHRLITTAEALLAAEPGPDHRTIRAEREKQRLAPAPAAALKKEGGVFHGTVGGERWYVGPERAVEELDPKALDPSMRGPLEFLRDRGLFPWLIGTPRDGVAGVLGVGVRVDADAETVARALSASILPGPPDSTRQALSEAAQLRRDGPPLGKRDASLLALETEPPSTGLRVRVLPIVAPVWPKADPCPHLLRPGLARFAELVEELRRGRARREAFAILGAVLPPLVGALAYGTGLLSPLVSTLVALIALHTAGSALADGPTPRPAKKVRPAAP